VPKSYPTGPAMAFLNIFSVTSGSDDFFEFGISGFVGHIFLIPNM